MALKTTQAACQILKSTTCIPSNIIGKAFQWEGLSRLLAPGDSLSWTQTRGRYIDWRMWRDVKRRRLFAEYHDQHLRRTAIKRNSVIPKVIQEIAAKDICAEPRDAYKLRQVNRCAVTSRPRGVQVRWRVSRLVWRSLADYNKLSGVTRSWW